ncbi:hypothetical protein [Leifsonia xyli]|uniref:hypothetical protein n=1 Tax=Leifsonia xyli TaxID=1575 RepID=UPI003D670F0A
MRLPSAGALPRAGRDLVDGRLLGAEVAGDDALAVPRLELLQPDRALLRLCERLLRDLGVRLGLCGERVQVGEHAAAGCAGRRHREERARVGRLDRHGMQGRDGTRLPLPASRRSALAAARSLAACSFSICRSRSSPASANARAITRLPAFR